MASLRSFMIRMNYLDRSSPFNGRKRRRRYSSATSGSSNLFTDLNHNELLSPIINPSHSRRKVTACIYKRIPPPSTNPAQSPQLAVEVFEGSDVKLRNEISIPVSTERFLAFVKMDSPDDAIVSTVYSVPRMVPVSNVSTFRLHCDTESADETIVYCTRVEFRRRYFPLAKQTIDHETHRQEDPDRQPQFVSYANWNVSECY